MHSADEPNHHAAHVAAWIRNVQGLPRERVVLLFEQALDALWRRASRTLGEVTLTAIVDRILYTASERYPPLASLKVETTGVQFGELRERHGALDDHLIDALRFVLIEFLRVLGKLTGEILTPALHAELSKVTPSASSGSTELHREFRNAARNDENPKS